MNRLTSNTANGVMDLKIAELKRMVNSIPAERDGESAAMYHPFYRRLFKIEAVDDLQTVRPDLDSQIVFITADEAYGP